MLIRGCRFHVLKWVFVFKLNTESQKPNTESLKLTFKVNTESLEPNTESHIFTF